ncbi:helix-turn-helix domain-containing protein [Fundicoccus culcitae]|uniref:Helix-turn-helix domain-containing protein n=1 Tax=Fundicoccus culcitae TaxID=2969821 RepID=A0ABY5P3Q2_9LACT|nr:helix-turn-helix transcriptional regulator [Fundicoccus culcitae]UUX33369.1 helix-turn-helix domain-containing protein [Fundicoccus culcitae]
MMRSDQNTVKNIKQWLLDNDKTQSWLAAEMDIAPSLISQLFSGARKLQPNHIEKFAEISGFTISELASTYELSNVTPTYTVRGKVSNQHGEHALNQLLLDVEHFVQLTNK